MAAKKLTLLHEAVRWATKLHRAQDRDGEFALPYITHPLDVVSLLRYKGEVTDENMLAIAILHDVVEQCGVTVEEVSSRFGSVIGAGVNELTRREPSPASIEGMDADQIWQLRADLLLEEIRGMSFVAKTVKLADRLSNLASARATRSPDRLQRYIQQTYLILEAIPRETCPALWDEVRRLADADVQ
jgi:(p)ppGpp synthase/HD superfamily hydrolase